MQVVCVKSIRAKINLSKLKVAIFRIISLSSFVAFLYPKTSTVTNIKNVRFDVCVNEMAPFGPQAVVTKGKATFDSNGSKGGMSTRRDSGTTKYECAPD